MHRCFSISSRSLFPVSAGLLLLLLAQPLTIRAQVIDDRGHFVAGLSLLGLFPQGDFKKEVKTFGGGGALDLGYALPTVPVVVGLTGGYAEYGSKEMKVPLGNIKVVNVQVTTTNSVGMGHLFVRCTPTRGDFRPYFEGLAGGSLFTTGSTVKDLSTDKEIASETNKSDLTFSYGGGGGIMYKVWHSTQTGDDGTELTFDLLIDLGARYLYGGKAEYYTPDAVTVDNAGNVSFRPDGFRTSKTDFFTVHLGVTLVF